VGALFVVSGREAIALRGRDLRAWVGQSTRNTPGGPISREKPDRAKVPGWWV
jgi:hypothetical protein